MTTALEGIRVLDFTRQMAGPYATLFLSDYGADVIKIEALPKGDPVRTLGTAFIGDESSLFLTWNRGKRSVAVDLRSEQGKDVVRRLVKDCDILVENYRPGVAEKIGIGYDDLSKINPGLIHVSVSAFGAEGPLAPLPGMDVVVQALSGIMSVTGEADGGPVLVGVPIGDFTGAMLAVQGALLGLQARHRTGRGQKVDVSMLYGLLSALTTRLASFWTDHKDPQRYGSSHSVMYPYQAFETADGYIVAGTWGDDGSWDRFCEALDIPEVGGDTRFETNQKRVEHRDVLGPILEERFRSKTSVEWEDLCRKHDVLCGRVLTFSEIFAHEQVQQAGIVQSVEHPTIGEIPQLGPVIFLRDTPGRIAGPPPILGQHTREVLAEFGYSDGEIDRLLSEGVAFAQVPGRNDEHAAPPEGIGQ